MSAKTTANTFFKEVIAAHGVPAATITDRGSAFSSALFTRLADYYTLSTECRPVKPRAQMVWPKV